MNWLRDGLAKLLSSVPQSAFVDAELVVFFDSPVVLRYVKGRVYDKAFEGPLDPRLERAWQQQQNQSTTQADQLRSPYMGQPFAHQYLHIVVLDQGLLLLQQSDYSEDLSFVPLLVTALDQLLSMHATQTKLLRYYEWLKQAGMNSSKGDLYAEGDYFTPYPAPTFVADANGVYPYAKLALSLHAPYSVIEVTGHLDAALLPLGMTWYRFGERFYTTVSTTDKRVVNKVVKSIQAAFQQPFTALEVHVARSVDPLPLLTVFDQLRGEEAVYYPPADKSEISDVQVALASTTRYKVRNHQNQWVADLFSAPVMTMRCELAWLSAMLKQPTPRTRYVELSVALATHPDTVKALKQHKLGGHMTRTAFIANGFDQALQAYIEEKNAIIGTRNWHLMMTQEVDVFLFDHVAGQDDEPLLDYLYHRQMTDGLAVLFPIEQQLDALWLINHNIGLYYMEDSNE